MSTAQDIGTKLSEAWIWLRQRKNAVVVIALAATCFVFFRIWMVVITPAEEHGTLYKLLAVIVGVAIATLIIGGSLAMRELMIREEAYWKGMDIAYANKDAKSFDELPYTRPVELPTASAKAILAEVLANLSEAEPMKQSPDQVSTPAADPEAVTSS